MWKFLFCRLHSEYQIGSRCFSGILADDVKYGWILSEIILIAVLKRKLRTFVNLIIQLIETIFVFFIHISFFIRLPVS